MTDHDRAYGNRFKVDLVDVDRWSRNHLGSGVKGVLFCEGHLSTVLGIELMSGRDVVVKIRPRVNRLLACAAVHRRLFQCGVPCPEPLVELESIGAYVASAESMARGGDPYPRSGRAPLPFAAALAKFIAQAPALSEVPSLDPAPQWTAPDFRLQELWPPSDETFEDLNSDGGPKWIDEVGWSARNRLAASTSPLVVGHGDWYTGNLRWRGNDLCMVYDFDSVVAASEAHIAGLAAAIYPVSDIGTEATVQESDAFLDAYQDVRGPFSNGELMEAWAAGLWSRSYDAKKQSTSVLGPRSLTQDEAIERQRRADGR
jgi:hypothetical protein